MFTDVPTSFSLSQFFCRGSNVDNFSKNKKEKEDNICGSSLENIPDSPCTPFIDNSHSNSLMNEIPPFSKHGEIKTFSEKMKSLKQPSTKMMCRCCNKNKNVQGPCNLEFYRDDNITAPRIIKLAGPGLDGEESIQKIEYRSNIEKYCLNLNPYSSKFHLDKHEQFSSCLLGILYIK